METLEGSKVFPYIAWTTCVLFALFTVHLALVLQDAAAYLEEKTLENVAALDGE